ncbi:MAG: hypothetical protein PSV35_03410, partial [bacterium]|nr:hypothetical protein [bacterium]
MSLNNNALKRNGLTLLIKKIIIYCYQTTRVCFYKLLSLNKAQLENCKINQPVSFMGQGTIWAKKVNFGIVCSPFYLNGYSYIEARSTGSTIHIGENTFINNNAVIIADRSAISIGSECLIGAHFTLFDSDFHGVSPENRHNGIYETKNVVIGYHV